MSEQSSPFTRHASRVASHGVFITGTDTGVGKTLAACALLHAYARRGLRAAGMKPVAAGASVEDGALVNEDVVALRAAANVHAPADLVNPYCFAPAIAPHIAAELAGVTVDIERIAAAYAALASHAQRIVVEGAGGFRVPLGAHIDTADLARTLATPVVLVVGMRLGCLNHALLTADSVRAAGLTLAGWIANHVDADMMYAARNVGALEARLETPLIARIPYTPRPIAARIAEDMDCVSLDARLAGARAA